MKKILCAVALVSTSSSAFAVNYLGTNFVAPNVKGYENVANETAGEIVYDTTKGGGTFWGYSPNNGWTSLNGGGTANATPAGTVIAFAGASCPTGYALANGTELNISDAPDLYAAIQDIYGDASVNTKFKLPNYTGQFLRGMSYGNGIDAGPRTASKAGLDPYGVGSTQTDEFKAHNHLSSLVAFQNDPTWINNSGAVNVSSVGGINNFSSGAAKVQPYTGNAGSGSETRPKNVYVNYCIKK
ncbi:tail fiber protein [Bdellovibrio sp. HCB185ZH]|uniref:tail fiber protein n=1 Tax=Bdellovibrio sp. HCB185ZH TaxID=3394235 RepID=UPI0039A67CB7